MAEVIPLHGRGEVPERQFDVVRPAATRAMTSIVELTVKVEELRKYLVTVGEVIDALGHLPNRHELHDRNEQLRDALSCAVEALHREIRKLPEDYLRLCVTTL